MPILPGTYYELTQIEKSRETYLKPIAISNLPTALINHCWKVILHDVDIAWLKLFCLGMYKFLGPAGRMDHWSVVPHKHAQAFNS